MLVSVRTKITIAAACAIRPQGFLAASTPRNLTHRCEPNRHPAEIAAR